MTVLVHNVSSGTLSDGVAWASCLCHPGEGGLYYFGTRPEADVWTLAHTSLPQAHGSADRIYSTAMVSEGTDLLLTVPGMPTLPVKCLKWERDPGIGSYVLTVGFAPDRWSTVVTQADLESGRVVLERR